MTRTMNMTRLLHTRKGLVNCSRRSPGLRVATCVADSGGAFPFTQWPGAKDSLTVARQRGLYTRFPVPPMRNARTQIGKERSWTSSVQDRTRTVMAAAGRCQLGCCGKLRLGELSHTLQRGLHLGVMAIQRGIVGIGRDVDELRHAHVGARERLGDDHRVPRLQHPRFLDGNIKRGNRNTGESRQ